MTVPQITIRKLLGCAFAAGLMILCSAPPLAAEELKSVPPRDAGNPLPKLISGYEFSPIDVRALQDDDFDNPGFAWVARGETLWSKMEGTEHKSCMSCHGNAPEVMRGRAAEYPKFYQPAGRVISLEQRINICRRGRMGAPEWDYGSDNLLGMTAYLRLLSRGMPVNVRVDGPAKSAFEKGQAIYNTRMGQLGMSCALCHNSHYSSTYGDHVITQGHSNGFPTFHRDAQKFTSLHDQFSACFRRMKAEPYEAGSDEYVALELYLAWRGAGLPLEAPAVRR